MAALDLREPRPLRLRDADWHAALNFCDQARLTLTLREHARPSMPDWVEERTARNAADNFLRFERLRELYQSVAGFRLAVLKGVTQTMLTGARPESRVQYDVDLFGPYENILAAREELLGRGYESLTELERFPTDHLPALIRKTGWEWRGDFFDLEIPTAIELHFRFWDARRERLGAPGLEEFWSRRQPCRVAGMDLVALHAADTLAYTALHLLRHLLRGNVTPFHVYELALMLDRHAADDAFWQAWRGLHSERLRRLEAVSFQFACSWFGCRTHPAAQEAIDALPAAIRSWFENFCWSPLAASFRPNKDELWLHWSLLDSVRDRWSVARIRLFPARLPGPVDAVYLPDSSLNWRRRARKWIRYGGHLLTRARHHLSALPRTAAGGAWWWLHTRL